MAGTIALTDKNFDAAVQKGGTLFIDFTATWCAPCQTFAPVYEQAAQQHPGVVFGKVDVDADAQLADDFDIEAVPTLIAIRDGVVVLNEEGELPAKMLAELIKEVQALDMDEVRSHLALAEEEDAAQAKKKAPAKKKAAPAKKKVAAKKKAAPAKKKAAKKKPARR